jgi:RNA-directed DNA polymerase
VKRYGNLFDKVTSFENMYLACRKALRGKRSKQTVAPFYFNLENELIDLRQELIEGRYQPRPYRIFEIREPKVRQICSSNFRDRVVHHSICNILEPMFERRFIYDTYACRPGNGTHAALRRCQQFSRQHQYFLKCDIKKYFPSIDHIIMKRLLSRFIKDQKLLALTDRVIDHSVPGHEAGKGLPIGNLTSQHFANLYLGELDHFLKDRLGVSGYLRYMDDFISFADTKEELHEILFAIREFCEKVLNLELKEKATLIAPVSEGVPFLGFRIFPNLIRLQRPNLLRFRRKVHKKETAYIKGKISEKELLLSIKSVIAHVSHADSLNLRRKDFERSKGLA